jgi:hypothetical protein
MNHTAIRKGLDDYVDGALSRTRTRETERHLETCAACRRQVAALRDLVDRAAGLAPGVEPARDLWPRLRARAAAADRETGMIPESPEPRIGTGFSSVLAAAAAIALFWGGARMIPPAGISGLDPAPVTAQSEAPPASPLSTMLDRMVWGLERETLGTGLALTGGERSRASEGTVDAETARAIDRSLEALDQAIQESLGALRNDPENAQLLKRVTTYYRLRLDLLHRTAALSRHV